MDRYRQQTELPWRNPISGGGLTRTYISEIAGAFALAIVGVTLLVLGLCL